MQEKNNKKVEENKTTMAKQKDNTITTNLNATTTSK